MSGLLDLLAPALSGKALDSIGGQLGLGRAETERGIDAALPAVLTKLKATADDPVASAPLVGAITKDHGGGLLDNLGDFFGGGHSGLAGKALGLVFGGDADDDTTGPVADIARLGGLGGGQAKGLLGMLVPLILGGLGRAGGSGLSAGALSGLLGGALGQLGGGSATKLLGETALKIDGDAAKPSLGGVAAAAAGLGGAAAVVKGAAGALGDKLPDAKGIAELLAKLKSGDVSWLRDKYRSGGLSFLKDRLPSGDYEELGTRLEKGDLGWVRSKLGSLSLPGFDAFKGLAGAVTGKVGGAAAAGVGALGAATGAPTGAAKWKDGDKKRPAWMWILPLLLLAALLALLLSQCGKDDAATTDVVTSESVATEAAATEAIATEAVATEAVATEAAATEAAATEAAAAAGGGNLLAVAGGQANLSTFQAAVTAAGLTDTLNGAGPFTTFAPSDDAFKALPAGVLDALLKPENKDALTTVLTYHVVPKRLEGADLATGDVVSVQGDKLALTVNGADLTVADGSGPSKVLGAGLPADNGIAYVIDRVLLPSGVDVAALLAPPTTEAAVAEATNAAGDATPEDLTVYFDTAKSNIRGDQEPKITKAIDTLKALPAGSKVNVVGHADNRGNAASNQRLSEKRAQTVVDALKAGLGADASNIEFAVSAKGDTEQQENQELSRRVTIEIQK